MRIVSPGHAVFAAMMIAAGIMGLVRHDFVGVWGGVPEHLPGREALIYVCAAVALACGLGLVLKPTAAWAARLLLLFLVLWLIAFKVQFIVRAPMQEVSYQTNGETAVIVAGAWVLYTRLVGERDQRVLGFASGGMGLRIARVLYAFGMFAFGFSHFAYVQMTAPLVPDFLPWHEFWAYFTGCAYIAAGLAILTGVLARLAATLSAVQMGLISVLVWIPLLLKGELNPFQWGEVVVTFVLTAAGWVMAESYRDAPWFAVWGRKEAPAAG